MLRIIRGYYKFGHMRRHAQLAAFCFHGEGDMPLAINDTCRLNTYATFNGARQERIITVRFAFYKQYVMRGVHAGQFYNAIIRAAQRGRAMTGIQFARMVSTCDGAKLLETNWCGSYEIMDACRS